MLYMIVKRVTTTWTNNLWVFSLMQIGDRTSWNALLSSNMLDSSVIQGINFISPFWSLFNIWHTTSGSYVALPMTMVYHRLQRTRISDFHNLYGVPPMGLWVHQHIMRPYPSTINPSSQFHLTTKLVDYNTYKVTEVGGISNKSMHVFLRFSNSP
jgi:hypothetical protein